jgi:spore coat protein A
MTRLSRRSFLALALASGAATTGASECSGPASVLGGGISEADGSAGALLASEVALPRPFTRPLVIPPVLRPTRTGATTDHYEIVQRPGRVEILPGRQTLVWGYNGLFPGPTLISRRGRRTIVTHRNELDVPVVVHLHGGRTPPEHDGYPLDVIPPRAEAESGSVARRDYVYPMDQPAGTLWYHDHRMDFTGPQVYRGLAGFHLVTDDGERALGLPSGERDVPLMIADRAFDAAGELAYPSLDPELRRPGVRPEFASGVLGDCILVNGIPWPRFEVAATAYRLRVLNASNARRYRLVLDPPPRGGVGLTQIGADANLLAAPVEQDAIHISQGERCDVVVDFGRYAIGDQVMLRNTLGSGGTAEVMRFDVTVPDRPPPRFRTGSRTFLQSRRTRSSQRGSSGSPWEARTTTACRYGPSTGSRSRPRPSPPDPGWGLSSGGSSTPSTSPIPSTSTSRRPWSSRPTEFRDPRRRPGGSRTR